MTYLLLRMRGRREEAEQYLALFCEKSEIEPHYIRRWMPLVALAAPALSALVQWWALKTWDYQIGFELLIYNAAFPMIGMLLLVKRHEK